MKTIDGRLVRVYLSHPLHDDRPFLANIRSARVWWGMIGLIPGVMCWAPWIDLAESDPDESQKSDGHESSVMAFCLGSVLLADVVLVVGEIIDESHVRGITGGMGMEVMKAQNRGIPVVVLDRGTINKSNAHELIRGELEGVISWPG